MKRNQGEHSTLTSQPHSLIPESPSGCCWPTTTRGPLSSHDTPRGTHRRPTRGAALPAAHPARLCSLLALPHSTPLEKGGCPQEPSVGAPPCPGGSDRMVGTTPGPTPHRPGHTFGPEACPTPVLSPRKHRKLKPLIFLFGAPAPRHPQPAMTPAGRIHASLLAGAGALVGRPELLHSHGPPGVPWLQAGRLTACAASVPCCLQAALCWPGTRPSLHPVPQTP